MELAALDVRVQPKRSGSVSAPGLPSWNDDRLGGAPIWLGAQAPAVELRHCPHCGTPLAQLLQLNCSAGAVAGDRLLYILACASTACPHRHATASSYLRVLRAVRAAVPEAAVSSEVSEVRRPATHVAAQWDLPGADDWGDDGSAAAEDKDKDDWASAAQPVEAASAAAMKTDELLARLQARDRAQQLPAKAAASTPAAGPATAGLASAVLARDGQAAAIAPQPETMEPHRFFEDWYLHFAPEPARPAISQKEARHLEELLQTYRKQGGVIGAVDNSEQQAGLGKFGEETYEKTIAAHGDEGYAACEKRLARMPEQILRYQFDGKFLPVTSRLPGPPAAPPCSLCGARKVFELQIMPRCLSVLQLQRAAPAVGAAQQSSASAAPLSSLLDAEPVDFGTAAVFVCEDDCIEESCQPGEVAYLEETVHVQPDVEALQLAQKLAGLHTADDAPAAATDQPSEDRDWEDEEED